MAAPRIESRFDTPGLAAASKRTSCSVSVTARLTFFSIASGSLEQLGWCPARVGPTCDIFAVGSCRSMIRAPTVGIVASGTVKVGP